MQDKIIKAFDEIKVSQTIKTNTIDYIHANTHKQNKHFNYAFVLRLSFTFIIFITAAYWAFLIPTAAISIDINPSIELKINRFDKVIKAETFNSEDQALFDRLNLNFNDLDTAINQILELQEIDDLLNEDALMMMAVVSEDDKQNARLLQGLEHHQNKHHNIECYGIKESNHNHSHANKMSCGKYRQYQILEELDPSITIDEVKDMSMREIKDLINSYSNDDYQHSNGHCHKHGHR